MTSDPRPGRRGRQPGNGIALYVRIASIMRTRIATGQLALGEQLPSIEQLTGDFSVAAVTIRKAISLLVEEGLLSSSRGKGTFVIASSTEVASAEISTPTTRGPENFASIVHRIDGVSLPQDLRQDRRLLPTYNWLRKLHQSENRRLFVMDSYVDPEMTHLIHEIPGRGVMLIASLAEELLRRRMRVETVVRVLAADAEMSELLECDLSFPAAQIRRYYIGRNGVVHVVSRATYRADIFELHTEQTAASFLASRSESSVREEGG